MKSSRRFILTTLGSAGDVHPFVGLGAELKRRGHEVILITSGLYAELAEAAGLTCVKIGTAEDARRLMAAAQPGDSKSQLKASREVLHHGLNTIHRHVSDLVEPGRTVLVSNQACMGVRLFHEMTGTPLITIVLQPFSLRSAIERRHYHPKIEWWVRLGPWARRCFHALLNRFFFDRHVAKVVNPFRVSLGLPPVSWAKNPHWHLSPQMIIGAWPEWFGPPQPDWPRKVLLTGFIMHDGAQQLRPDAGKVTELTRESPIIFTPGSWVVHGQHLFRMVIEAAQQLERPAWLVTRHPAQIPQPLPPGIRHLDYTPFGETFPQGAVLIHHAGVGTTAQALRAGRPQLCVPLGGDQYDNAARVEKLGAGRSLSQSRWQTGKVVSEIQNLLGSSIILKKCRQWSSLIDPQQAVSAACDRIEAFDASQVVDLRCSR